MNEQTALARGPFASGPISKSPGPIAAGERDPRYDNQPPLDERILLEFMEDLETHASGEDSVAGRIATLIASARRAPEKCDSEEIAGKMGDLCAQARNVTQRLDAARERHNRPLLNAQRALKGRADCLIQPLNDAIAKIRRALDDFARAEAARRAEEQRKAEEEARRAREALERENVDERIVESIAPPPPPAPAPIGRGDLGARVGTQKVWCHKITSVRQLPDRLLKHPKVVEVLDKLVAAEIKAASGKVEIKGVEIWQDTKARVA